ncbi:MAG: hypothetical protein ACI814_004580, partial [Mariniblastus sp.]
QSVRLLALAGEAKIKSTLGNQSAFFFANQH